jgi:hypothetical protein
LVVRLRVGGSHTGGAVRVCEVEMVGPTRRHTRVRSFFLRCAAHHHPPKATRTRSVPEPHVVDS